MGNCSPLIAFFDTSATKQVCFQAHFILVCLHIKCSDPALAAAASGASANQNIRLTCG